MICCKKCKYCLYDPRRDHSKDGGHICINRIIGVESICPDAVYGKKFFYKKCQEVNSHNDCGYYEEEMSKMKLFFRFLKFWSSGKGV